MRSIMTKEEFKARWESNESGGGITYDEIADCAQSWGIASRPRICPIHHIRYAVLKAAQTVDAEKFFPVDDDEDENNA
jgi:hypothetical protein